MDPTQYDWPQWPVLLATIGVATIVGALIGYDRERKDKPAGLRTHALVCVASALAMMVAVAMDAVEANDGTRGAQAIMAGIGFLGAGAIMRRGEIIHGLKTGATIWAAGAAGVAIGAGWYAGGIVLTLAVVLILTLLKTVENILPDKTQTIALQMQILRDEPFPVELLNNLRDMRFQIESVSMGEPADGETTGVEIVITSPKDFAPEVAASVVHGSDLVSDISYHVR